jgi:ribonuclease HI
MSPLPSDITVGCDLVGERIAALTIYSDGAARGNPGPAGVGAVLLDESGTIVDTAAEYIGEATNNVAEYMALITGLKRALGFEVQKIRIFLDSELLVRQLTGVYRVKNSGLKPLFTEAQALLGRYRQVEIAHVPREKNREADKLANEAIDKFEAGETEAVERADANQGSLF